MSDQPVPLYASFPRTTGFRSAEGTIVRPHNSKYSQALAHKICERIMEGETLNKITQDPRMPTKRTVLRWLNDPQLEGFRELYYNARRVFAELVIDEVIELADDSSKDWIETYNKHGQPNGWKPDHECVQRARLRIDTRKWLAAKMIPRVYGEKLEVEHGVTGDLKELLQSASNNDRGLPGPIIEAEIIDE